MSVSLMFGVLLFLGEGSLCNQEDADEFCVDSEPALSLLQTKAVKLQVKSHADGDPSENSWLVHPAPCPTGVTAAVSVQAKSPVIQPLSAAQTGKWNTGDGYGQQQFGNGDGNGYYGGDGGYGNGYDGDGDGHGYYGDGDGDGYGDGDGTASDAPCNQGPVAATCTPICTWSCISNPCDETCEPVCEQPQCQTRCGAASSLAGCAMTCNKPKCVTFCRKPCATQNCPWCTTKCGKPVCSMKCPESCHEVCNSPVCKWECKDPVACPKPVCELTCAAPTCQTGGSFQDFAPLQPGEVVVNTFAAPAGTAKTMALLQEDGKKIKTATKTVEVEVSRVANNLTLVHDRTMHLPVQV